MKEVCIYLAVVAQTLSGPRAHSMASEEGSEVHTMQTEPTLQKRAGVLAYWQGHSEEYNWLPIAHRPLEPNPWDACLSKRHWESRMGAYRKEVRRLYNLELE